MTYDVLKDCDDTAKYPVEGSDTPREVKLLSLAAGDTFIPATIHYPQNKVDALVANGTIKLREKVKPEPVAPSPPSV